MFKKLNIFALTLLLVGQIILGPIATVSAASIASSTSGENTEAVEVNAAEQDAENNTPTGGDGTIVTPETEETPKVVARSATTLDLGQGDVGANSEQNTSTQEAADKNVGQESTNQPAADKENLNVLTLNGAEDEGEDRAVQLADFTTEVPTTVIKTVTSTKFAEENYRPKMGEEVTLELFFELPDKHNYGEGSILTYPLTDPLTTASGSGDLLKDGIKYATYSVSGKNVIITFNNNIRFFAQDGISSEGLKTTGNFEITAKYSSSSTNLDQSLTLPNDGVDETITINFQPVDGKKVEKIVDAENGGDNSNFVTWTVNVNTEMTDLADGKIFEDSLGGKHKYVADSLVVKRYKVGTDGSKNNVEDVTGKFPKLDASEQAFELILTGKYAYEIKYKTVPDDSEEAKEVLENTASFNGKEDSKKTTITYGAPLEKAVSKDGEQANWTINVNQNRKPIASGVTITDSWDSDKHILLDDKIEVSGLTFDEDYSITTSSQGFEITLLKEISEPFTITYATKPNDLVTGTIDVENTVVRSDRSAENQKVKKTAKYSQNVISKSNSNINYQTKTVDWTILLNQSGYPMSDIVLDDTFVNENLKIKDGTFKVDGTPIEETNHKLNPKGTDGKEGFTLNLIGIFNKPIKITYTTEYDVRGVENLDKYKNTGKVKWKTSGKEYGNVSVESTVDINQQQKDKGYKSGIYNYEEKKFYWEVGINYNFDTVENPSFTDTLSDSQVVDRESIKVYPLDLSGGGNGKINGSALTEGTDYTLTAAPLANTFTIAFKNSINTPYKVVYESKDKDDYYAPKTTDYVVGNKAELTGTNNTYAAEWNAEPIKVEHTKKLLVKDYSQVGNSAYLNWTLNLNWGQSKLDNVVIKDNVGLDSESNPNQMIYKDTFKICEMNFSGTKSEPVEGTCYAPGEGLYEVSFDDPDSTFTIRFKQAIDKAYVVKYDTYFLGASGDELKNIATLSYSSNTENEGKDIGEKVKANFSFSGSASTKKGQLEITKVDENSPDIKLSGAEFELWTWDGASPGFLIERVSTDIGGVYTFKTKVGQTEYYLKETKAPDGYSLRESDYYPGKVVKIEDTGSLETPNYVEKIEIGNTKLIHSFKVKKVDAAENALSGAIFKLQKDDGTDVVGYEELVSDADGWIIVNENLEPGKYQLVETKAPIGYKLLSAPVEFEIDKEQIAIEELPPIQNKVNDKSVTLLKYKADKDGVLDETVPLAGAEFTLYKKDGTVVTDSSGKEYKGLTTDNVGELLVEGLDVGTYYFLETKAPNGYQLDRNTKHEFEIKEDESTVIKVGNKVRTGGGGWTPPTEPENPTDPEEPGTEPENPTDPEEPGTEPENPTDPEEPGTEPENPTDPEEPGTNPEKPTNPEDPSGEDSEDLNGKNPTKPGDNGNLNPDEDDKGQDVNGNVKPDTGDNSKDNGVNKLPQTGEEVFLYMLVLGILFVTAGGWIFCSNKRKKA